MTILIDNFISSDNVRSVVGISDEEVPDEAISAMELEISLLSDTADWLSTYSTIKLEGMAPSPTDAQLQQFRLLKLYAIYYCAEQVVVSMQLNSLSVRSDGNHDFRRFEEKDKFGRILQRVRNIKNRHKEMLLNLITGLSPTTYTVMGTAEPDYDPITDT